MDFSPEGLKRRAVAVFCTLVRLHKGLPRKLTPELKVQGEAWTEMVLPALRMNPVYRQAIYNCFDHREAVQGLLIYLTPNQCQDKLQTATAEALESQLMYVNAEIMAALPRNSDTVPLAAQPHLQRLPKVWVRLEILLTSEEDNWITEFFVLDSRCALEGSMEEDLATLRRRAIRDQGIPTEKVDSIMNQVLSWPPEVVQAVADATDTPERIGRYMSEFRACARPECAKYGITLLKCSGCRAVYYCGRECQLAHWPLHKPNCKKPL